jgi:predicted nucleotide-binding protein
MTILVPRNQTSPFLKVLKNSVFIVFSKNTIHACMDVLLFVIYSNAHFITDGIISHQSTTVYSSKFIFNHSNIKFHVVIITYPFLIEFSSVENFK